MLETCDESKKTEGTVIEIFYAFIFVVHSTNKTFFSNKNFPIDSTFFHYKLSPSLVSLTSLVNASMPTSKHLLTCRLYPILPNSHHNSLCRLWSSQPSVRNSESSTQTEQCVHLYVHICIMFFSPVFHSFVGTCTISWTHIWQSDPQWTLIV